MSDQSTNNSLDPVSVEEIIKINFSQLSLEEKVNIKNRGRSTPGVDITQKCKEKGYLCLKNTVQVFISTFAYAVQSITNVV